MPVLSIVNVNSYSTCLHVTVHLYFETDMCRCGWIVYFVCVLTCLDVYLEIGHL